MTVGELIEKLKTVAPNMEVVVEAPDSGYYSDEYYEYGIFEEDIDISFGKFSICAGYPRRKNNACYKDKPDI